MRRLRGHGQRRVVGAHPSCLVRAGRLEKRLGTCPALVRPVARVALEGRPAARGLLMRGGGRGRTHPGVWESRVDHLWAAVMDVRRRSWSAGAYARSASLSPETVVSRRSLGLTPASRHRACSGHQSRAFIPRVIRAACAAPVYAPTGVLGGGHLPQVRDDAPPALPERSRARFGGRGRLNPTIGAGGGVRGRRRAPHSGGGVAPNNTCAPTHTNPCRPPTTFAVISSSGGGGGPPLPTPPLAGGFNGTRKRAPHTVHRQHTLHTPVRPHQ